MIIRKIILATGIALALLGITTKLFARAAGSETRIEVTDSASATAPRATGYVKGITSARAISLFEGVIGLTSIVIGWRARARSTKGAGKTALVLGLLAITFSIAHLTFTAGSVFGSGSGKAGAIVALLLGLAGSGLGGMALRSGFSK